MEVASPPAPSGIGAGRLKLAVAALGIAVGLGSTLVPRLFEGDEDAPEASLPASQATSVLAGQPGDGPAPTLSTPGAASAAEAVEQFLSAEQRGDLAASFELLSAEDRRSIPSVAAWVDGHRELLPRVVAYELRAPEQAAGGVVVPALVSFTPGLNEFSGLTPEQADARWSAVEGQQGWRVFLGGSTVVPVYPPDSGAAPAAQEWLANGRACDPGAAAGPGVTFLGLRRDLVNRLCRVDGAYAVGAAVPVDDPVVTTDLVAAFGPASLQWARVVPADGPTPVRLLMAPIGERWAVVDVLAHP